MQLSMQQYKIRKPITERTFHVCPVIFTDHFTVAVLLPCAVFANTAKGTAVIIHNSVSGMDNQILYSSFYSADDGADEASTVFSMTGSAGLPRLKRI